MESGLHTALVTIACGGTGGHLFPGVAVAEALGNKGVSTQLLISTKAVDQLATASAGQLDIVRLPALPPSLHRVVGFSKAFWRSCRICLLNFRRRRPSSLLVMGGFTSAPAVLAARLAHVPVFLHEANAVPGRANRCLAPLAREVFVYFPQAARRLRNRQVSVTGMPVRSEFRRATREECCRALGLAPDAPVLLVTGGSQGARPVNRLMEKTVGILTVRAPQLQYVHLTGPDDAETLRRVYRDHKCRAFVSPFFGEMWFAMGAATLAVTRAGASSMAEQAATRLPAILIPYPHAADNHQYYNAKAFCDTGAACLLPQTDAAPEPLANLVLDLLQNSLRRVEMQEALAKWDAQDAADTVAERLLTSQQRVGNAAAAREATGPLTTATIVGAEVANSHVDGRGH